MAHQAIEVPSIATGDHVATSVLGFGRPAPVEVAAASAHPRAGTRPVVSLLERLVHGLPAHDEALTADLLGPWLELLLVPDRQGPIPDQFTPRMANQHRVNHCVSPWWLSSRRNATGQVVALRAWRLFGPAQVTSEARTDPAFDVGASSALDPLGSGLWRQNEHGTGRHQSRRQSFHLLIQNRLLNQLLSSLGGTTGSYPPWVHGWQCRILTNPIQPPRNMPKRLIAS